MARKHVLMDGRFFATLLLFSIGFILGSIYGTWLTKKEIERLLELEIENPQPIKPIFRRVPTGLSIDPTQFECLAKTIYFEARNQTIEGQLAVANVVMERVARPDFPSSICDVVTEARKSGKFNCQFTWYCDGKSDTPKDRNSYFISKVLAMMVLLEVDSSKIVKASHYHADYVDPDWGLAMVAVIGNHKFYE